jgi:hypothetical protein
MLLEEHSHSGHILARGANRLIGAVQIDRQEFRPASAPTSADSGVFGALDLPDYGRYRRVCR